MPFFSQASSDLSILDLDIPYALSLVAFVTIEIMATICAMVSVTWQVLIVAVPATVASIYVQVSSLSHFYLLRILLPYQKPYIENYNSRYIQSITIHDKSCQIIKDLRINTWIYNFMVFHNQISLLLNMNLVSVLDGEKGNCIRFDILEIITNELYILIYQGSLKP